ncbi:MAG TPA: hypothetical protein DCL44_04815 [Elusimicrobia bacterium]|nr:hypothetical protein [Elusimicrobiota bacterium]
MSIEHGIRLGSLSFSKLENSGRLKDLLERFDWVYLGPEFCENLLENAVVSEIVRFQEKGKKVCLLTPLLSEKGLKRLTAVFKKLIKLRSAGRLDINNLEITVNDFGALELAERENLPFKINIGRQLYDNIFVLKRTQLRVLNRLALDFFTKIGINRYELSTIGIRPRTNFRDRAYGFNPKKFSLTLYYPYLNLTTTRTCMVGMPYIAPDNSVRSIDCDRECRACAFEVTHPWIKEKLLIRGNTMFIEFPDKFYSSEKELKKLRVDRLVYCPFP